MPAEPDKVPEPPTVEQWLESAPPSVKQLFSSNINVLNFWRSQRNEAFQMQGMYDGSMSEACKALCKGDFDICDAIVKASDRWSPFKPQPATRAEGGSNEH